MMRHFAVCALVLLLCTHGSSADQQMVTSVPKDFGVWGYLPEYRNLGGFDYEAAFQTGLTHLIFFSLEIDPITGLPSAKDRLPPKDAARRARIAADKVGGKVILSFGGNSRSQGFPTACRTKQARLKYLKELNEILVEYEFDGVDYNWEYPRNEKEWRQWADLLRESKQYLLNPKVAKYEEALLKDTAGAGDNNKNKLWNSIFEENGDKKENYQRNIVTFTMYLDPNHYDVIMKFDLLRDADAVHCMAYDNVGGHHPHGGGGKHSTMDFAKYGIELAKTKGFDPKKFTLGVPFYGRHVRNGEPMTWYDVVEEMKSKPESEDMYGNYYFNNKKILREKTQLSVNAGIGGVMIWEIGQDKQPMNHESSLMQALFDVTKTLPQALPSGGDPSLGEL